MMSDTVVSLQEEIAEVRADYKENRKISRQEGLSEESCASLRDERTQLLARLDKLENRLSEMTKRAACPVVETSAKTLVPAEPTPAKVSAEAATNNDDATFLLPDKHHTEQDMQDVADMLNSSLEGAGENSTTGDESIPRGSTAAGAAADGEGNDAMDVDNKNDAGNTIPSTAPSGDDAAEYTSSCTEFGRWNVLMVEACKGGTISRLSKDGKYALCGVCTFTETVLGPNTKRLSAQSIPLRIRNNVNGAFGYAKWNDHAKCKTHINSLNAFLQKKRNSQFFGAFKLPALENEDGQGRSKVLKVSVETRLVVTNCPGYAADINDSFIQLYIRYCRTSIDNDIFNFRTVFTNGIPATTVCYRDCTQRSVQRKAVKKRCLKDLCDACFNFAMEKTDDDGRPVHLTEIYNLRERLLRMEKKKSALDIMMLEEIHPALLNSLRNQLHAKNPASDPPGLKYYFLRIQSFLDLHNWRVENASVLSSIGVGLPPLHPHEKKLPSTNASTFIVKLVETLRGSEGKKLEDSIPMAMVRALVAKLNGHKNPKIEGKLAAFSDLMHGVSPAAYRFLRNNTEVGPCERHLKTMHSHRTVPEDLVYNLNVDAIMHRLKRFVESRKANVLLVSLSYDATVVPPTVDVVTAGQQLKVGGAFPNHLCLVTEPTPPALAKEIKCCLLSSHTGEPHKSSTVVLAARPSTSGEGCVDFMESTMAVVNANPRTELVSIAFDGAKSDAYPAAEYMVKYLKGDCNTVSIIDPNHTAKNLRSALVLGTRLFSIGTMHFDKGLFALTDIPFPLYNVSDYTSDALVLKLASRDSILQLFALRQKGHEVAPIVLYLLFLRLYLMGVNGDNIPRQDRVIYLWSSLLYLTSVNGLADVTKSNLLKGVFGMIFLTYTKGVKCLRLATTEGLEHKFGEARQRNREFSASWFLYYVLKLARRMDAIAQYNLKSSHSSKGYGATSQGFQDAVRKDASRGTCSDSFDTAEEILEVDFTQPLVFQIAPLLIPILNKVTPAMKNLLTLFGVKDFNPLFGDLTSSADLHKMYYAFMDSVTRRKLDAAGLEPSRRERTVEESKVEEMSWDIDDMSGDIDYSAFEGYGIFEEGDPFFCSAEELEEELEREELQLQSEIETSQTVLHAVDLLEDLNNLEVFPPPEMMAFEDLSIESEDDISSRVELPDSLSDAAIRLSAATPLEEQEDYVTAIQDYNLRKFFGALADNRVSMNNLEDFCVEILPSAKGNGSISQATKFQSRDCRWYGSSKGSAEDNEENAEAEETVTPSPVEQKNISRGVILIIKGKLYKVLACFEKGYNKWRLVKESNGGNSVLVHVVAGKFGGALNEEYRDVECPVVSILKSVNVHDVYTPGASGNTETRRRDANALRRTSVPDVVSTPIRVYKRGERVLGKFEQSRRFFRGTVMGRNGTGTYHVQFDHGDNKGANPRQNAPHVDYAVSPLHLKPLPQVEFNLCDKVLAIWNGSWNWQASTYYKGTVIAKALDEYKVNYRYSVRYDDNDLEVNMAADYLKKI